MQQKEVRACACGQGKSGAAKVVRAARVRGVAAVRGARAAAVRVWQAGA